MTSPGTTSSRRPLAVVVAAGLVIVVGVLLAYVLVLRGDERPPLALPTAGSAAGSAAGPSLPAATAGALRDAASLAGRRGTRARAVPHLCESTKLSNIPFRNVPSAARPIWGERERDF